jgi:hypothetical protein
MARDKLTEAEVREIRQFLRDKFPHLPDSAYVRPAIAAVHDDVSVQTVDRHYERIQLSKNRWGVNVGYLRRRDRGLATA